MTDILLNTRAKIKLNSSALQHLSLQHPIRVSLMLLLIALAFRIMDIFVLRLDERWGEIILSKFLGFALVLAYLWAVRRGVKDIGLHSDLLGKSVLIAAFVTMVTLVSAYAAEWVYLTASGAQPSFALAARGHTIDPELGMQGGLLFGMWLIIGNFVNSFMEEGLFRGVMIPHFRTRLSFWQANFLQALLFGLWHLVWPIKYFVTGQMDASTATMSGITYVIAAGINGLVWGYLYLKTNNLWAPWVAHTMTNSTLNLLHTVTAEGFDPGLMVRGTAMGVVFLLSMLVIRSMAERFQMPEARAWDQGLGRET